MSKSKYQDESYIGKKFGMLTIVGFSQKIDHGWKRFTWTMKCDCGNEVQKIPTEVVSGKCRSCGCYHDMVCKQKATKFKHSTYEYKRLYGIYNGIKKRCFKKNDARYPDYGGRGITMCDEWHNPNDGFDKFVEWSLANGYADDLTIERNDVNGNYCPENCSWITLREQRYNQRGTVWVDYKGERIQLMKLCERLEISYDTAHDRIRHRGWPVERAIEEPSCRTKVSLMEKARMHGINYGTVRDRIFKLGWSEERALNTPSVGRGANKKTYSVK